LVVNVVSSSFIGTLLLTKLRFVESSLFSDGHIVGGSF